MASETRQTQTVGLLKSCLTLKRIKYIRSNFTAHLLSHPKHTLQQDEKITVHHRPEDIINITFPVGTTKSESFISLMHTHTPSSLFFYNLSFSAQLEDVSASAILAKFQPTFSLQLCFKPKGCTSFVVAPLKVLPLPPFVDLSHCPLWSHLSPQVWKYQNLPPVFSEISLEDENLTCKPHHIVCAECWHRERIQCTPPNWG